MILLDSNHLTVLRYKKSGRAAHLAGRLAMASDMPVGTSIVSVEESMRGWLATIAKERELTRQISPYRELAELFAFFAGFHIALLDQNAIDRFEAFRKARIKIGTMDLKIAAIALANNALLLTANRRDFEKVPGLRFENWID